MNHDFKNNCHRKCFSQIIYIISVYNFGMRKSLINIFIFLLKSNKNRNNAFLGEFYLTLYQLKVA
jgi:hypothetical protein